MLHRPKSLFSTLIIFISLIALIFPPHSAQAATFDLTDCTVTTLSTAVSTANSNGQDDVINLFSGCTYTLTATLSVTSDSGHSLTIQGNGSAISGGGTITVFTTSGASTLILNNVTIQNGKGSIRGGGINNASGAVTVTNSTFTGNSGPSLGGGIYNDTGTVTISNSTFSSNSASQGGAVYHNGGTLNISNTTFSSNTVTGAGGAIVVSAGTLTMTNSSFTDNAATSGGNAGAISASPSATINITGSTFTHNQGSNGGAIMSYAHLTINTSTFVNNIGNQGGTIINIGTLTITDSTFSGNTASYGGAVVYNSNSTITASGSTFSNNTSTGIGGGGFYVDGGTVTITDSTFSGNSTNSGGGGLHISTNGGTVTLKHDTFSGNGTNTTTNSAGGIYRGAGTLNIGATIVTNSTHGDCLSASGLNLTASNWIADGSCSSIATFTGDPKLGPLQVNSPGTTATHALLSDSGAINAVACDGTTTTDQRGVARPQGVQCDIGAYEFIGTPPVAADDTYKTLINTQLNVSGPGLLANDTGIPAPHTGNTLHSGIDGTLTIGTNGGFVYTPPADFTGIFTFIYSIANGFGSGSDGTLTITVGTIPAAHADQYTTGVNTPLNVNAPGALGNDTGFPNPSVIPVTSGTAGGIGGTYSITSDGHITYTPPADTTGIATLPYTITNGFTPDSNGTIAVVVSLLPYPVNDTYITPVNTLLTVSAPGVLGNDIPFSGSITAYDTTTIHGGNVTLNADGSFTYTPPLDFTGYDSFTYTLTNGLGSTIGTVWINVIPNSTPGAAPARNYFTTHQPTLTWNRVPTAIQYEVQVTADKDFTTPNAFTAFVPADQLYVQTTSLNNGSYFWRVHAQMPNGNWSGWSIDTFVVNAP